MEKEICLPMVIRYRKVDGDFAYTGFIPGITTKDVIEKDFEKCKELLKEETKKIVIQYLEEKKIFPLFPTKEELLEDFDDIKSISFIKISI